MANREVNDLMASIGMEMRARGEKVPTKEQLKKQATSLIRQRDQGKITNADIRAVVMGKKKKTTKK